MTFQEAISETGVATRMDNGLRIYRDKRGAWAIKDSELVILPSEEMEGHTDWQPVVMEYTPDEHILELLTHTKQQLDKLIKLTENYI